MAAFKEPHFPMDIINKAFRPCVWVAFSLTLLACLLVMYLMMVITKERKIETESWSALELLSWIFTAASQQGYELVPKGPSVKFVFFLGFLCSLLVFNSLNATIVSTLQTIRQVFYQNISYFKLFYGLHTYKYKNCHFLVIMIVMHHDAWSQTTKFCCITDPSTISRMSSPLP